MELIGNILFDVLAMLVTLGILVTFHEYGHYWVAKKCGVKVEKFSIGFGKPLIRWREKQKTVGKDSANNEINEGTEFVIAAIPLGGYVKMLGEQNHEIPENQKQFAFNHKPLSQRAAIVAAGPAANFLLAILLYWVMFMSGVRDFAPVVGNIEQNSLAGIAGMNYGDEIIAVDDSETRTWQEVRKKLLDRLGESGDLQLVVKREDSTLAEDLSIPLQSWLMGESEPDILGSLGITPIYMDIPPRIGELVAGRAMDAGFESGDLVLSVDGLAIDGWDEWVTVIRNSPETDLAVQVDRRGQVVELVLRPDLRRDESGDPQTGSDGNFQGYIGAAVELPVLPEEMVREMRFSPFAAMGEAVRETWENSLFVLGAIKKMIIGLMSVNNISGPITIAQIAGDSASDGLEYFIGFLAILSISLGVMNLLPIPVLDGGHLFYYAIEAIIRKPIPEGVQEIGMRFGLLVIAGIMFIAFYNDINRLF